ncbi:MAG: DUF882 domain-containing protein [Gammaproteobacteria bacterium]|nr:DUF882 domain-containing protein [Gammaproteobacteria bacterium]
MTEVLTNVKQNNTISRRNFLHLSAGMAAAVFASPALMKTANAAVISGERNISLYNIHTGEILKTVYWQDGHYIPEAMAQINHILRDRRNGEIEKMDKHLIDMLAELHHKVDGKQAFQVISGYRSPATNTSLRKASSKGGVAKKSLHMRGMAIDIRLPKVQLERLRKVASQMRRGGVGYYPRDGFIHVDVGRVRYWGQKV